VGKDIYLSDKTSWGTKRYNISDKYIRSFLKESFHHYIKNLGIDGFRIDNVDGILRYGPNGEGEERPFGRKLLREINSSIYKYSPKTIINFEAHYFYKDNAKKLVEPLKETKLSLGATAYTSSRLSYFFHKDFMPKSADDISPWTIKHIIDEKEWGKSNSTIADFHNHDAAAGLMHERATGSYAYDALILKDRSLHPHAFGKIQVMEAIIGLCTEGRILDLLQTFLLQEGTFEHDSTIHWHLKEKGNTKAMIEFKRIINNVLKRRPLWPINNDHREIINIDNNYKTFTIKRFDPLSNEAIIANINMSAFKKESYIFPVNKIHKWHTLLDNHNTYNSLISHRVNQFEFFEYGIEIDLKPYSIIIITDKN
jgi:hypothetical protein